ncbi:MAG: glycerol kinase GlpK [Clostridia bacterium]|nr:glycerol kinase GlpK [Clostridia bacterium]
MSRYVLAVDQSTQGTKGLLFDEQGVLVGRSDCPHQQIINEQGWVSHNPMEIRANTLKACRDVIEKTKINKNSIVAMGISNQRETTVAWNRESGESICNAIVWQCARATELCEKRQHLADMIQSRTGMNLSPYFPAAKMGWIMENVPEAKELAASGKLALGTIDSWLVSFLSLERNHKTDYSNASRTQLFDISKLCWDKDICDAFGIPMEVLPQVSMSDSCFGMTDLDGFLEKPIPIHSVLGDSHGALFGQNCRKPGQVKATYGTGSSVMMNVGDKPKFSQSGLVTSLAWGMNGKVEYVFEGNLNYTGAVMTWLRKDVGLIEADQEATEMAYKANPKDRTYFVPAFSGLGAPYWDAHATGLFTGISRTTGRNEIAKACLDCIAYQITDLTDLMRQDSGVTLDTLRVDGGPTASRYLMQFQSDMAQVTVQVPNLQELSGMGAAYAAGIAMGLYDSEKIYDHIQRREYLPALSKEERNQRYAGWKNAVKQTLNHP